MTLNKTEKINDVNVVDVRDNICDFSYLADFVRGNKQLINRIMDAFLKQVPNELLCLSDAIKKEDFITIKNYSHTIRSSVSIMGISVLTPILMEIENLGENSINIKRIKQLNQELNLICDKAIKEIKKEKNTIGKNYG